MAGDDRYFIRLAIGFFAHPKAIKAGRDGRDIYITGLCWSRDQLTDGAIPAAVLGHLAYLAGVPENDAAVATDRLVDVGLWERTPDGWQIHDYADHQLTRADIDGMRAKWRQQKTRSRTVPRDVRADTALTPPGFRATESESETLTQRFTEVSRPSEGCGETDDGRAEAIATTIGQRRHQAAADRGTIRGAPARHLATCIRNALNEHGPHIRQLIAAGATNDIILATVDPTTCTDDERIKRAIQR